MAVAERNAILLRLVRLGATTTLGHLSLVPFGRDVLVVRLVETVTPRKFNPPAAFFV